MSNNYNLRNQCIEIAKEKHIKISRKYLNYIPYSTSLSVYDIDYDYLYSIGKRYILFDLDNTLASYDTHVIQDEVSKLIDRLEKMGFKVAIISNNNKERLEKYLNGKDVIYTYYALKPKKHGYRRIYKKINRPAKSEIVTIGDQIMTDAFGGNRFGLDVIIVKSIKRSNEKWYTVINRKRSVKILNKIKEVDEFTYNEIMKVDKK